MGAGSPNHMAGHIGRPVPGWWPERARHEGIQVVFATDVVEGHEMALRVLGE